MEKAPKKKKRKTVGTIDVFQSVNASADSDDVVLTAVFADHPRMSRMSHSPPGHGHSSQPA